MYTYDVYNVQFLNTEDGSTEHKVNADTGIRLGLDSTTRWTGQLTSKL